MPEKFIQTARYKLYPVPRSPHREVFAHEVFVPYPYALIDLPSFRFKGRASLFAAYRLADGKMGQLVTFELESDQQRFERLFVPD